MTLGGRHMATGSLDKTIRVWSLADNHCVRTLTGHLKGVWCLRFFARNLLLSGSYDASIKVGASLFLKTCINLFLSANITY